jgi:hypothetical protein
VGFSSRTMRTSELETRVLFSYSGSSRPEFVYLLPVLLPETAILTRTTGSQVSEKNRAPSEAKHAESSPRWPLSRRPLFVPA